MLTSEKKIWKTDAAGQAFSEIVKFASDTRLQLEREISVEKLTQYEIVATKINIAESFTRMLSEAYRTATHIDCEGLVLRARVEAAFMDTDR